MATKTSINGIEELKAAVGQEVGVSDWYEVTQEAINDFAEVTKDFQWTHVDPARAAQTPFGVTIAHGLYTLSLGPKFSYEIFEMTGHSLWLNYGYAKVRFLSPVKVGSRVRATMRLVNTSEIEGGIKAEFEQVFEIQGEEKPACYAEA